MGVHRQELPVPRDEFEGREELFTNRYEELKGYDIGDYTYGRPQIIDYESYPTVEKFTHISIGKYCSIADGVKILKGGNHRVDWISTYPFNFFEASAAHLKGHPTTRGDVRIGNDVWIGRDVTILSGVRIGDGAVIGAGSIVVKDVPAYAIAAGNPARTLKYRFEAEDIQRLLANPWWQLPHEKVKMLIPLLMSGNIKDLVSKISNQAW